MTMLSDILKSRNLFSKEIKTRFANRQIQLNGEPLSGDIEIGDVTEEDIIEVGDFVFELIKNTKWSKQLRLFGLENIIDSNIANDLTEHLKDFMVIRTSKKEAFVIKRK